MSLDSEYRKVDTRSVTHFRTYEPIVIGPSNNRFTPSQELNIRQTSIAGDVFYNWNDSYLELKLKTKSYTSSSKTTIDTSTASITLLGQPACLVDRITGDAKFINPDGTESAIDLTNNSLNIGMYRSLINLVYQPRSFHTKNAYLTEYPYQGIVGNTDVVDSNGTFISAPFKNTLKFVYNGEYHTATLRLPWSSLLDLGMQTYLCNMKSINLKISWVSEEKFFVKTGHMDAIEIASARTITDYYRVSNHDNLQIPDDIITIPEINPIGNYETIAAGTKRWHHSYRIPYAPAACFIFFTGNNTTSTNAYFDMKPIDVEYLRVYTGSGWSNTLPQYENDASCVDSRYYDTLASIMNNDEEHIINFMNFNTAYRIYAIDFMSDAELLQSQNEIFFELRFKDGTITADTNVHVVFIENPPVPVSGRIAIE